MTLQQRPATPDDCAAIYAICMHAQVSPYLSHDPMPRAQFEELYRQWCAAGGFFVCECDGAAAGFYRVLRQVGRARHVAQLATVAINPSYHRRGVGRRMLEGALATLRQDGIVRVELMVETDNAPAVAFYRSLGFHVEAVLERAYRRAGEPLYVDDLLMVRFLD